MTSRDIIKAVLDFSRPPRIGMTLPEPYVNDMVTVQVGSIRAVAKVLEPRPGEIRRWLNQWGCVWASLTDFDGGEVVEGAIKEWSDLDRYVPPDLGRKEEYAHAAKVFSQTPDLFHVGQIPGFTFAIARKLRKLDQYLCDLITDRTKIQWLHALVRTELIKAIDGLAEAGADAIFFCEDWGTQDRLMISPDMWREVFKPEFKILAGRAHQHGMYVIMHSCGKMTAIIDDLIACGINALQFDQPRLHGIDLLSDRFGGRVTFWSPVDIQRTLQTRDPESIRRDAKLMIEKFGGFGGGFIAGYYESNESIGITPDIQDIACRAFVEHGIYAQRTCRQSSHK